MKSSDYIDRIEKYLAIVGDHIPHGATSIQIEDAQTWSHRRFNFELPPGYVALLKKANGLDFNGTVLFSTDEEDGKLADTIQSWNRTLDKDGFIYIGKTEMDLLAYERDTRRWVFTSLEFAEEVNEAFPTFEEFILRVLEDINPTDEQIIRLEEKVRTRKAAAP